MTAAAVLNKGPVAFQRSLLGGLIFAALALPIASHAVQADLDVDGTSAVIVA